MIKVQFVIADVFLCWRSLIWRLQQHATELASRQ